MTKEKIILAIPAFGGNIHLHCFRSIFGLLKSKAINDQYDLDFIGISNEALISRARQDLAKYAMDHNYDRIFFIDADISFTAEQFLSIVASGKDVIAGTYMVKTWQNPRLNFNLFEDINTEMIERYNTLPNTLDGFKILQREYCRENPIIKARHIPTGFLCIATTVLKALAKNVPYYYTNQGTKAHFTPEEMEKMKVPELFPVSIKGGCLESEDWGFCRLCQENTIDIYLHTGVVVEHHGSMVFHPRLFKS